MQSAKGSCAMAAAIAAVGIFSLGSVASAATYNYTVGPGDLQAASSSIPTEFGWDGDAHPPVGDNTAGAGGTWGNSSFVSNVDGLTHGVDGPPKVLSTEYQSLRLNLNDIFQTVTPLTLSDLKSVTWYTKNNSNAGKDWAPIIYTYNPDYSSDWYAHRINAPQQNAGDADWHQWDTDDNAKPSVTATKMGDALPSGTHTLNEIATFTYTKDSNNYTYGDELVEWIDMHVGDSGNHAAIANNLDGIVITLNNGDVANINLVPEPASLSLLAIGGLALLGKRRRRSA